MADDALLTWVSYIPEGNSACINTFAMQRDPRNFSPSTNTFWPDRWLVAEGVIECPVSQGEFVHNTSAFIPFSFGKPFLVR
jgi:cytochrome P450